MNLSGSSLNEIAESFNLKIETKNLNALKSTISQLIFLQLLNLIESPFLFQSIDHILIDL